MGIFHPGDTALAIATRYKNTSIVEFLTGIESRECVTTGSRSLAKDGNTHRSPQYEFAAYRADVWTSSFDSHERGRRSYVNELEKTLHWVARLRTTRDAAIDPMDLIPFFVRSPAVHEIQSFLFFQNPFADLFADHFLIWTHQMQTRLSPHEIAAYPLSYSAGTQSPLLLSYSSFVNDVSRWVEVIVLSEWDGRERARHIEFFVCLMERLMERRGYLACMGVGVGLQSAHVAR